MDNPFKDIPYLPVDETEEVLVMSVGSGSNDNEADEVVVDVAVERDGDRNLKQSSCTVNENIISTTRMRTYFWYSIQMLIFPVWQKQ